MPFAKVFLEFFSAFLEMSAAWVEDGRESSLPAGNGLKSL